MSEKKNPPTLKIIERPRSDEAPPPANDDLTTAARKKLAKVLKETIAGEFVAAAQAGAKRGDEGAEINSLLVVMGVQQVADALERGTAGAVDKFIARRLILSKVQNLLQEYNARTHEAPRGSRPNKDIQMEAIDLLANFQVVFGGETIQ